MTDSFYSMPVSFNIFSGGEKSTSTESHQLPHILFPSNGNQQAQFNNNNNSMATVSNDCYTAMSTTVKNEEDISQLNPWMQCLNSIVEQDPQSTLAKSVKTHPQHQQYSYESSMRASSKKCGNMASWNEDSKATIASAISRLYSKNDHRGGKNQSRKR